MHSPSAIYKKMSVEINFTLYTEITFMSTINQFS